MAKRSLLLWRNPVVAEKASLLRCKLFRLCAVPLLSLALLISACLGGSVRRVNIADPAGTGRMLTDLEQARVVFVGEFHDQRDHHQLQLQIVKHLHERGVPLAIGFEMFSPWQQPLLDRWVRGEVPLEEFVARYLQGWSISWAEYDTIMLFARNKAIPMVALDAPAELVQAVNRYGAGVFSSQLRQHLPVGVTTGISKPYREFLSGAFLNHRTKDFVFENFCAAQGLRNSYMARRIAAYLDANPKRSMVVIAGVGHAIRRAVPSNLAGGELSVRIVIPKVEGLYEELEGNDMDYFVDVEKR